jgi:outer membrane immunogenic protein
VTGGTDLSGGIVGVQAGFNWHAGILVVGGEIDGQWSGQQATFTANCGADCSASEAIRIRALVTARGRAGIAYDWIMGYVTGGAAFLNAIDDLTLTIGGVTGEFLPLSSTALGWIVGAGVEFAVWEAWSVKLEYLYLRVTDVIAEAAIPGVLGQGTASLNADFSGSIVRFGVNYRFGPASNLPYPATYLRD